MKARYRYRLEVEIDGVRRRPVDVYGEFDDAAGRGAAAVLAAERILRALGGALGVNSSDLVQEASVRLLGGDRRGQIGSVEGR